MSNDSLKLRYIDPNLPIDFMNGNFARSPSSSFNNNTNKNQQSFVPHSRQPNNNNIFDFQSIYDDTDDFFEAARNFPASGRKSVPVGFRAGELSNNKFANEANDTSSGYSTASSIAPSSSTYWTRKGDEFVPIKGKIIIQLIILCVFKKKRNCL